MNSIVNVIVWNVFMSYSNVNENLANILKIGRIDTDFIFRIFYTLMYKFKLRNSFVDFVETMEKVQDFEMKLKMFMPDIYFKIKGDCDVKKI